MCYISFLLAFKCRKTHVFLEKNPDLVSSKTLEYFVEKIEFYVTVVKLKNCRAKFSSILLWNWSFVGPDCHAVCSKTPKFYLVKLEFYVVKLEFYVVKLEFYVVKLKFCRARPPCYVYQNSSFVLWNLSFIIVKLKFCESILLCSEKRNSQVLCC